MLLDFPNKFIAAGQTHTHARNTNIIFSSMCYKQRLVFRQYWSDKMNSQHDLNTLVAANMKGIKHLRWSL